MHRIFVLFVAPLLMLALVFVPVEHGTASILPDQEAAPVSVMIHDVQDLAQKREGCGKSAPHPIGCHGHQTVMASGALFLAPEAPLRRLDGPRLIEGAIRDIADPAFRPPIS